MPTVRRVILGGVLGLSLAIGSGCTLIPHSLHPDQLWRLNQGPNPMANDPFFSISDSIPENAGIPEKTSPNESSDHSAADNLPEAA